MNSKFNIIEFQAYTLDRNFQKSKSTQIIRTSSKGYIQAWGYNEYKVPKETKIKSPIDSLEIQRHYYIVTSHGLAINVEAENLKEIEHKIDKLKMNQ